LGRSREWWNTGIESNNKSMTITNKRSQHYYITLHLLKTLKHQIEATLKEKKNYTEISLGVVIPNMSASNKLLN
jgi:hypothetical protein